MNICIVSVEYPPDTAWGGVGMHKYALAHGMADRGHLVHVISLSLSGRDEHGMDGKVYLHRLADRQVALPLRIGAIASLRVPLGRPLRVRAYLRQLHARVNFDVVEAQNWGAEAVLYSLQPSAPLVVRLCTSIKKVDAIVAGGPMGRARRHVAYLLERLEVRRAAAVVASSRYMTMEAARLYGVPARRISIVPLGIARSRFPRSEDGASGVAIEVRASERGAGTAQRTVRRHDASPVVFYAGRLEQRKGVRYLLEAIPRVVDAVPEVRFRLAGRDTSDAPGDRSYEAFFADLATVAALAATTFLGHVDPEALGQEYATCTVFAAPSLFESFGQAHLEAMEHGKPVVACATAATPELVLDGETGILVPARDSQALAEALIRLLRDPQLAGRMGERGRARAASRFSVDALVEGTLAVYQGVRVPPTSSV